MSIDWSGNVAKTEKEVKEVISQEYMDIINKYPEVLKPNFKEAKTKHGITHKIKIKQGASPCTTKVRPLLPGSQKAVEGQKAWQELVDLGIVEKVAANTPVPWSSALHLQPKASGGYRPCSDFRGLNLRSEDDDYPLLE